jgi:hypothetical protein
MIETISEWETEKKVKAKRQKEQKEVFVDSKALFTRAEYCHCYY